MIRLTRWSLAVLAGLSLTAQDPFAFIPSRAQSFDVFAHPKQSREAVNQLQGLFQEKGKPSTFAGTHAGIDLDQVQGLVVTVDLPKEEQEAPKQITLLPLEEGLKLLKQAGARLEGKVWSFRPQGATAGKGKGKRPSGPLFAAREQDGVLVVATSKAILDEALSRQDRAPVSDEMKAWLKGRDAAVVAVGGTLARTLEDFKKGFHIGVQQSGGALAGVVAPLSQMVDELVTSVDQAAFGVRFQEGGVRGEARVFFRPGSPMAVAPQGGGSVPAAFHRLPAGGYVLASGWDMVPVQGVLTRLVEAKAKAVEGKVEAATLARWREASLRQAAQGRSGAVVLGPAPLQGLPLTAGIVYVQDVEDATRFIEDSQTLAEVGGAVDGVVAPESPKVEAIRNPLPDVPSLTLNVDLATMLKKDDPKAAQTSMGLSMLFGGSLIRVSSARVDDHTIVTVIGDAELLKMAIQRMKEAKPLAEAPAVKAQVVAAPLLALASPKGVWEAAQTFMAAMGAPAGKPFTAGETPVSLWIARDGKGLSLHARATREALEGIAALVKGVEGLRGAAPAPETTEH